MEVDKAANKVADMVADKKRQEKNDQHGAHPACASSKLCEFMQRVLGTKDGSLSLSYCMVLRGISWYCMIYVV